MLTRSSTMATLAFCGLVSLGGAVAPAQQAAPADSLEMGIGHRVSGAEVPRRYLVHAFFLVAPTILDNTPEVRRHYMVMFGIEPDSPAETALLEALDRARDLLYGNRELVVEKSTTPEGGERTLTYGGAGDGPNPFDGVPEEEWDRVVVEQADLQSRALADIWFDLEQAFAREGVSMEGIEYYLLEELAPGVSLASAGPITEAKPAIAAFEDQMSKRRQLSNFGAGS